MIVQRIREGVRMPERAHYTDSGVDLFIPTSIPSITINSDLGAAERAIVNGKIKINSGESVIIPMGVKLKVLDGFDITLVNKSGIASKTGLIVGACLIDKGYTGEIKLNLINTSNNSIMLSCGQKIVQAVVRPIIYSTVLEGIVGEDSDRGEGGFGSTGV